MVVVRQKVYRTSERDCAGGPDPNALAAFIAAAVPLYEYPDDPATPPRILDKDASTGSFRNEGRELHFMDGSPVKRRLAVQAAELAAVIEKLIQTPREAASR